MIVDTWQRLHPSDHGGQQTIAPSDAATPDNRGWAYADGFFTTMGVMAGRVLWLEYHQKRLITHARALQLDVPTDAIMISVQEIAQSLGEGMIKLVVTREPQAQRGYGFGADDRGRACSIWIKASKAAISTQTMTLPDDRRMLVQPAIEAACLTARIACLPPPLAGLKSLNRLDNVLASGELYALKQKNSQLHEGLVRDMSGDWAEGTMSNVFYQFGSQGVDSHNSAHDLAGQWFTPPMTQSGVAGVMRAVIIEALAATNCPVVERPLTDEDLPKISAMFVCNAVRGMIPVSRLYLSEGEVVKILV